MSQMLRPADAKYVQKKIRKAQHCLAVDDAAGAKAVSRQLRKRFGLAPGVAHLTAQVALHQKQYDEAWAIVQSTLAKHPGFAPCGLQKARLLFWKGDHASALEELARIAGPVRNSLEFWRVKFDVLLALGELDEAVALCDEFRDFPGGQSELEWAMGDILLRRGDHAGWAGIEHRYKVSQRSDLSAITCWKTSALIPHWTIGAPLPQRLVVFAEQGLGDTIHFLRYLKPLVRCGVRICLSEFQHMHALLSGYTEDIILMDRNVEISSADGDAWIRLMSVPSRLQALGMLPPESGQAYLHPRAIADAGPPQAAAPGPRKRVGLVWRGNPDHAHDRFRSCRIEDFAPVFQAQGLEPVCLQFDAQPVELDWFCEANRPLATLRQKQDSFIDFAEAARAVDLVISVDSAPIHVTGAMGIKGIVLVNKCVTDWRWDRHRPHCLYDSITPFRQRREETRQDTIRRLAHSLVG